MVLRAGAVESFAEPQPGESSAVFHVAVDGQAHHAGTADSPWDIESALAGAHAIPNNRRLESLNSGFKD
jgi:hypothetical protein